MNMNKVSVLCISWLRESVGLIDLSHLYKHLSRQSDSKQYTTKLRTMNKYGKPPFSLIIKTLKNKKINQTRT